MRVHGPVGSQCSCLYNQQVPPHQGQNHQDQMADPLPCSLFEPPCSTAKILKRILRASCNSSSRKLAAILNTVTSNNDEPSCERLLREEADSDLPKSTPGITTNRAPPKTPWRTLHAARVAAKLEEGDFRGAICLASSDRGLHC